jgi:site-specific recombinase XerD
MLPSSSQSAPLLSLADLALGALGVTGSWPGEGKKRLAERSSLTGRRNTGSAALTTRTRPSSHVFMTERGAPMTPKAFHALFGRIGGRAKMPFAVHPHMLRHGCGYALANAGHDTRSLQAYLGHKNIQHTVRYTELAPDRLRDFWR